MARKGKSGSDALWVAFAIVGLLVMGIQKYWPYLIAVGVVALIIKYLVLPAWRAARSEAHPRASDPEDSRPVMREVEGTDGQIRLEVNWPETFIEIKRAIDLGRYDFARTWLQKFAYTIVDKDIPQSTRDQFKRLMSAFAERDPLYQKIFPDILKQVGAQPGIMQTAIYPLFPRLDTETLRYVLYFAESLGQLRREKKGRSYRLFPAAGASERIAHSAESTTPRTLSEVLITEITEDEAILRHPLFSRLTEQDIETNLRARGLDSQTVAGVVQFYLSQKEAFLRDISDSMRNRKNRPVLMYSSIQDDRTCDFCKRLDGKFIRIDESGDFISRLPPFALGCRTSVISLTEGQRMKRGGADHTYAILKSPVPKDCPCGSWVEQHYWR